MFKIRELSKKCKYKYEVTYTDKFLKTNRKKFFNTLNEIDNFKNELFKQENIEQNILDNDDDQFKFKQNLNITIFEAVNLYLETINNSITKKTMKHHYNTILCQYGKIKVKNLTKKDIEKWKLIQISRNVSNTTIYHRLSLLRSAFNFILKKDIIKTHCFRDIIIPRPKYQRIDPLSINELKSIYKVAPNHIKRILVLGSSTGARIGPSELFKLKWSDIDFDKNIIYITNADKGGSNNHKRPVPIRNDIKDILVSWYNLDNDNNKYVVSYNNKPVKSVSASWKNTLRRAGITRRVRPYDLRHTFATLALMYGGDLKCISELMGHTDTKMILKTYQHTTLEQKKNSINTIPNIFSDNISEKNNINQELNISNIDKINFLNILLSFINNFPNIKYE